jgi:hypothetical protein
LEECGPCPILASYTLTFALPSSKATIKIFCNIDYGLIDILAVYMDISPLSVCVLTMEFFIYLFILFPYIPFRYIPWKRKTSQSIYIIRQLAHGITSIAKVENYLSTTVITFLN